MRLDKILIHNFLNIPGWHTLRKIIVFESDDWGSIRIPSKEAYEYLKDIGYPIEKTSYGKDSLESNKDLTSLLEVLSSYKTFNGQNPIFTLNILVANPDFGKIRQVKFKEYYYEPFIKTYERYPNHNLSQILIKEGIKNNLFKPQLHGREHLNVGRWLDNLQNGNSGIMNLFDHEMYGLPQFLSTDYKKTFQCAFDFNSQSEIIIYSKIITEACNLFEKIWGFRSLSFISPNFLWDSNIEEFLEKNGIKFIQGQRAQITRCSNNQYKAKYHYTGQKNSLGQIYLVRNCYFEPTFYSGKYTTDSCLSQISSSFQLRKPAIISTHRVNYIGGIDERNRDKGLRELLKLLTAILKKWPDVEFMSSDQVGELISVST